MENKELEEMKKIRNQYYKDYRAKHKDKIKAINNKYWINKSKKVNEEGEKVG